MTTPIPPTSPRGSAAGFTAPPKLKDGEERRMLKRRDPEDRDAAVRRAKLEPWWPAVTGSQHPAFARGYWLWTVTVSKLPPLPRLPPTRYWHGGYGGLRRGDRVLPSSITGAHTIADHGAAGVCRRDRVYVTTSEDAAKVYAALHPSGRGKVYEVEPVGELAPDPDCTEPGLSWEVAEAKVLRVVSVPAREREEIRRQLLADPELQA